MKNLVIAFLIFTLLPSGIFAKATDSTQIKGIPPEVFASARLEQQINALRLNKLMKKELAAKVQQIRDFRSELEIERKILLLKLRDNEIAISASKRAEKEIIQREEAARIDRIYKELGVPNPANTQNNPNALNTIGNTKTR